MTTRCLHVSLTILLLFVYVVRAQSNPGTNALRIERISVNDTSVSIPSSGEINIPMQPGSISFVFGATNSARSPIRLRAKLEGFENDWHEGAGFMFMALRFFNANGDQITQTNFIVTGDSPGWNGSPESSPWIHRHESVIAPPQASYVWALISSAGPPTTVGIYAVTDLKLEDETDVATPAQLLRPLPYYDSKGKPAINLEEWQTDGTHMSMAKIINLNHNPAKLALAIVDDDPMAHAEWHNIKQTAPQIHPGERLGLDWNEVYSMGEANLQSVRYPPLLPGNYRFRVIGLTLMGMPDGNEASIGVYVPQPFWKRPATVLFIIILLVVTLVGINRYFAWLQMRRQLVVLKNQRAMEQERLRIARDIHDDLGARVTQISILAASSLDNAEKPDAVKVDLHQIKQISRDLVSALYETVWMVNPECDNLTALGDYLCQMVDKACKRASLRCRIDLSLPPETVQVSGHVRHNLAMAMKEAINNAVKHAQCSEITIRVAFKDDILQIEIHDDGIGFDANQNYAGNGLKNIKHRLTDMGGDCTIKSEPGKGTVVILRVAMSSIQPNSN